MKRSTVPFIYGVYGVTLMVLESLVFGVVGKLTAVVRRAMIVPYFFWYPE